MNSPRSRSHLLPAAVLVCLGTGCLTATADVTVQQQTTVEVAIVKAHGSTTELTTADKQRADTELHCEGLMSLICGNSQGAEITRLDKEVTWSLEPKKKEYRESHFLSAAERQAFEEKMRANFEKLKQCPAPAQSKTPTPDTSQCEMSPPKIDVHQTDQHASLVGHDSRLTQLALTSSCHNKQTNDTCDFTVTLDSWLTQDEIAGLSDVTAFRAAYLKKVGLDDPNSQLLKSLQQFLAPYREDLKKLSAKAGEFKGYPLKTDIRIAFGGPQCSKAKEAQASPGGGGNAVTDAGQAAGDAATSSASGAAGSAAQQAVNNAAGNSVGGSILGSAASAFGSKLAGGLFAKKSPPPAAPAAATPAPAGAPNMIQVAQITTETTAITPGAIPASQFEIPAGWKLVTPTQRAEKEFSCPNTGT